MKRHYATYGFILLAFAAWCQNKRQVFKGEDIDREYRQQQEIGDLYARLSSSRFVVVGTVSKDEPVKTQGAPRSIDSDVVGFRYAVAIEDTLCRKEDLDPRLPTLSVTPNEVDIFVPFKPPVWGTERLELGQRYLLFLVVAEEDKQKEWTQAFTLDPHRTYYRGEELARGVIQLARPTADNPNPVQPQVLEKVTQLCKALREPELPQKLSALNQLAASDDAVLKKEAQEALIALQTAH